MEELLICSLLWILLINLEGIEVIIGPGLFAGHERGLHRHLACQPHL